MSCVADDIAAWNKQPFNVSHEYGHNVFSPEQAAHYRGDDSAMGRAAGVSVGVIHIVSMADFDGELVEMGHA